MDRPWLDRYHPKTRKEIPAPEYSSLTELVKETNKKYSDRPAFTCMGKTMLFSEMEGLIDQLARYLQHKLGIKKGDRVAIMMPNILQYPVALFACHRVGAIVVNVNPLYTARELEHQLNDSGASTIIILENFAHTLAEINNRVSIKNTIITKFGDLFDFPKQQILNFVLKYVKKVVPNYQINDAIAFKSALSEGAQCPGIQSVSISLDDLAFLQYTGGTTGLSKGAMLTHKNIIFNIFQANEVFTDVLGEKDEIIITALPLYHIFSLVCNCLFFMIRGGRNVLIPNPRDMPGFAKELCKWQFTAISGVNTLFNTLMQQEDFQNIDFSRLKISIAGGMAMQKPVADQWEKLTGNIICQAYGLTETSPAVTINPRDITEFDGSIGLPIPNTDVCIKDDQGNTLPYNEPGELCVKGPQVMKGYWQRDDETKKVFDSDGWFHTGDIATMADSGFVTIVDRKKDMLIVSGFNVYPNEIEEVVVGCDGILEAAVIGVPDSSSGEAVKLFVVTSHDNVTAEDIKKHCATHLVNYKRPKHIVFVNELPKSPVGKVLRRLLKDSA